MSHELLGVASAASLTPQPGSCVPWLTTSCGLVIESVLSWFQWPVKRALCRTFHILPPICLAAKDVLYYILL